VIVLEYVGQCVTVLSDLTVMKCIAILPVSVTVVDRAAVHTSVMSNRQHQLISMVCISQSTVVML
jgi:hypothetical protein